jgi:hypothetical protein
MPKNPPWPWSWRIFIWNDFIFFFIEERVWLCEDRISFFQQYENHELINRCDAIWFWIFHHTLLNND